MKYMVTWVGAIGVRVHIRKNKSIKQGVYWSMRVNYADYVVIRMDKP